MTATAEQLAHTPVQTSQPNTLSNGAGGIDSLATAPAKEIETTPAPAHKVTTTGSQPRKSVAALTKSNGQSQVNLASSNAGTKGEGRNAAVSPELQKRTQEMVVNSLKSLASQYQQKGTPIGDSSSVRQSGSVPVKQSASMPIKQSGSFPIKQSGSFPIKQSGSFLPKPNGAADVRQSGAFIPPAQQRFLAAAQFSPSNPSQNVNVARLVDEGEPGSQASNVTEVNAATVVFEDDPSSLQDLGAAAWAHFSTEPAKENPTPRMPLEAPPPPAPISALAARALANLEHRKEEFGEIPVEALPISQPPGSPTFNEAQRPDRAAASVSEPFFEDMSNATFPQSVEATIMPQVGEKVAIEPAIVPELKRQPELEVPKPETTSSPFLKMQRANRTARLQVSDLEALKNASKIPDIKPDQTISDMLLALSVDHDPAASEQPPLVLDGEPSSKEEKIDIAEPRQPSDFERGAFFQSPEWAPNMVNDWENAQSSRQFEPIESAENQNMALSAPTSESFLSPALTEESVLSAELDTQSEKREQSEEPVHRQESLKELLGFEVPKSHLLPKNPLDSEPLHRSESLKGLLSSDSDLSEKPDQPEQKADTLKNLLGFEPPETVPAPPSKPLESLKNLLTFESEPAPPVMPMPSQDITVKQTPTTELAEARNAASAKPPRGTPKDLVAFQYNKPEPLPSAPVNKLSGTPKDLVAFDYSKMPEAAMPKAGELGESLNSALNNFTKEIVESAPEPPKPLPSFETATMQEAPIDRAAFDLPGQSAQLGRDDGFLPVNPLAPHPNAANSPSNQKNDGPSTVNRLMEAVRRGPAASQPPNPPAVTPSNRAGPEMSPSWPQRQAQAIGKNASDVASKNETSVQGNSQSQVRNAPQSVPVRQMMEGGSSGSNSRKDIAQGATAAPYSGGGGAASQTSSGSPQGVNPVNSRQPAPMEGYSGQTPQVVPPQQVRDIGGVSLILPPPTDFMPMNSAPTRSSAAHPAYKEADYERMDDATASEYVKQRYEASLARIKGRSTTGWNEAVTDTRNRTASLRTRPGGMNLAHTILMASITISFIYVCITCVIHMTANKTYAPSALKPIKTLLEKKDYEQVRKILEKKQQASELSKQDADDLDTAYINIAKDGLKAKKYEVAMAAAQKIGPKSARASEAAKLLKQIKRLRRTQGKRTPG